LRCHLRRLLALAVQAKLEYVHSGLARVPTGAGIAVHSVAVRFAQPSPAIPSVGSRQKSAVALLEQVGEGLRVASNTCSNDLSNSSSWPNSQVVRKVKRLLRGYQKEFAVGTLKSLKSIMKPKHAPPTRVRRLADVAYPNKSDVSDFPDESDSYPPPKPSQRPRGSSRSSSDVTAVGRR